MKMRWYAIFDTAVQAYMRPFLQSTDEQAQRSFGDAIKRDETLAAHPEHYALFHLGTWCDHSGVTESTAPECLMTGLQAVADNTVHPADKVAPESRDAEDQRVADINAARQEAMK